MPTKFTDFVFRPQKLKRVEQPQAVNLRKVLFIGTSLWVLIGLVALIIHSSTTNDLTNWIQISSVGAGMGVFGLVWDLKNQKKK